MVAVVVAAKRFGWYFCAARTTMQTVTCVILRAIVTMRAVPEQMADGAWGEVRTRFHCPSKSDRCGVHRRRSANYTIYECARRHTMRARVRTRARGSNEYPRANASDLHTTPHTLPSPASLVLPRGDRGAYPDRRSCRRHVITTSERCVLFVCAAVRPHIMSTHHI